jgi:hypothetical protein
VAVDGRYVKLPEGTLRNAEEDKHRKQQAKLCYAQTFFHHDLRGDQLKDTQFYLTKQSDLVSEIVDLRDESMLFNVHFLMVPLRVAHRGLV